jgi:hypothetical protein
MTASTLLFGATSVLGFNLARLFTQAIMPLSCPGIGRKRPALSEVAVPNVLFHPTNFGSWPDSFLALYEPSGNIAPFTHTDMATEKKTHCEMAPLSPTPGCQHPLASGCYLEGHAVLSLSESLKLSYRYYAAAMLTSRPHARPSGAMTVPHHSRLAIPLPSRTFIYRLALQPGEFSYNSHALKHQPVALGELLF